MHLHRYVRNTLLMLGVTLLVLPAALSDGHERHAQTGRSRTAGRVRLQGHVPRSRTRASASSRATAMSAAPASSARRSPSTSPAPACASPTSTATACATPPTSRRATSSSSRRACRAARRHAAPFAARKVVDQSHKRRHGHGAPGRQRGPRLAGAGRHYPVRRQWPTIPINIADWVGRTPMVQLTRLLPDSPAELYAKLEMFNPGGSVKDRIGVAMIEAAEAEGRIEPGRTTIVEATSGNTGIALAFVAAAKGYDLILTLPQGMSREREALLRLYGAQVHVTESLGGMNEAVAAAQALARDDDFWLPDQFSNPANPEAHRRGTGPELWEALDGRIDCLVAGAGTGGTITGAGGFLKERNPKLRLIAVEPASSPVLSGGRPGPHKIQGIGPGFVPPVLDTSLLDEVIAVDDEDALETARLVARREGVLAGISCGAALYAAMQVAQREEARGCADRGRAARLGRALRVGAVLRSRDRGRGPLTGGAARDRGLARSAVGAAAARLARPPRRRVRAARGQPARRPGAAPAVGLPRARRGRRPGADGLRDPGLPRARSTCGRTARRSSRRCSSASTRCSRAATARRRSSCSSTRGRATAARSSSTRVAPGPTWTTCATRSSRSSTSATPRCPGPSTAG